MSGSADERIVITGIGLTAPIGNNLPEFRRNLLRGKSGIRVIDVRYFGKALAGVCDFDPLLYQSRKELRRGTRAGSIAIYCANEAIRDAGIDWTKVDRSRVGVYLGITEHGNVETENEIYQLKQYDYNLQYWSHHHNPRTVANNPAGEVTLNLGILGPHYTVGGACAAGNLGVIQGAQMLLLGECDIALCGGVSESIHTFGIFASFRSQGALAWHDDPTKASRPFDKNRSGIVVSEGGCIFVLERLSTARRREARIYGEIAGYASNSDAFDPVIPNPKQQAVCIKMALERASLSPEQIDIVSTHATGTQSGDVAECQALRSLWQGNYKTRFNNTKSFIGHAMGAAGALELAGNLLAFDDHWCHATINLDELDPECELPGIVPNKPVQLENVEYILNNSFGMLGINSVLVVRRFRP